MCLHAPTSEDGLSLYCAAQRDNGSLNIKVDDGHNTVCAFFLQFVIH